ncbi:MAG: glycosyltransferase [Alphaproteobacteria bacterium]|nr:glycosyltransferase [Alphaproteobacteria bacterium]
MKAPAIRFISALSAAPWGAAETLWADTALRLIARGCRVAASVRAWPQRPGPVAELASKGVEIEERSDEGPGLLATAPGFCLTVLQQPDMFAATPWMTLCRQAGQAYVTLTHYGAIHEWPPGDTALALRAGFLGARANYFVSNASIALAARQSALRVLPRAQLVRAPFKVPHGGERPWPGRDTALRLACVGRLDLEDKGQDALLHVLARPPWRKRPVTLSLIGDGPHRALLQAMIRELALEDRVTLTGPVRDIQAVWDRHHALALASRAEGLPAVIVEAMLCGRPCVVSDVAGNRELLDDGVTGFIARTPGDDDMAGALERLWAARARLPAMGAAAAAAARAAVPPDPASVFADMLLAACP